MMTTRAPASRAAGTTPAIGHTESLVPTASMRSDRRAASPARARSAWTSACPKEIVADLRMPPQVRQAGSSSPALTRSSTRAMGARSPQERQPTSRMVPWISMTRSGDEPAS
jgi:hypothetical protein